MSLLFGQKSKFSVFSQEEREELKVKIQALFESIDGSGPPRKGEQRSYRDGEIDRDEFRQLRWEQIEEILGEEVMRKRFIDVNNDGKLDMEDVWLQLDTNEDSKITPLEFLHECLGEAFVYPEDAKEAYDVYRDQEFHLPVPQLGNALRALGLNPSELEVMMIVNKYDTNADGYIDPDEWKSIVEDILHFPKDDRDRLRDAFTLLAKNQRDANGDPSISTEELVFVAGNLGFKLSESEMKEMIHLVDTNGDGDVQFEEFVKMVQKLPVYSSASAIEQEILLARKSTIH
eukprot:m.204024 g.204024  ORF g.204024 m.204024 type:complete len:288 (+) comp18869_c0_seq1:238-1101(+)